jgi:hypothetical protein
MDKFIVKIQKPETKTTGWKPITVTIETFDKIVLLQQETGLSRNKLVDMAITFALDRLEVHNDEE